MQKRTRMAHLRRTKGLKARGHFTEENGLCGGFTSLKVSWNRKIFNPGDEIQMACLWFCFAQLLQDDLDKIKLHWYTHLIRGSSHDIISGRPNELFFLPELYGGVDGLLHPILDDEI